MSSFDYDDYAIIPLIGSDGKSPGVKGFTGWHCCPAHKVLANWRRKFANANIGLLTGPINNLTVLDIDDPKQVDDIIRRAGDTPLKTRTPSGGVHAYYQYNGERCANLRNHGYQADIKATGGYVVAPPSCRFRDGVQYEFICGGIGSLTQLPVMNSFAGSGPTVQNVFDKSLVKCGERNTTLFQHGLRQAPYVDCFDDLLDKMQTINDEFASPLSDEEVVKTAKSAWRYERSGQNWVCKDQKLNTSASTFDRFCEIPNPEVAWYLYSVLLRHHRYGEEFAISVKAMAGKTLPWGEKRIRAARNGLEQLGLLEQVHEGGRGKGDPHLFKFLSFPSKKGG